MKRCRGRACTWLDAWLHAAERPDCPGSDALAVGTEHAVLPWRAARPAHALKNSNSGQAPRCCAAAPSHAGGRNACSRCCHERVLAARPAARTADAMGHQQGRAKAVHRRARSRDLHRSLQSAWQPTLSSESLAGYAPAMNAAAGRLAERLAAVAAADGELDMLAAFFRVAVDVVGAAVFGRAARPLAALENRVQPYIEPNKTRGGGRPLLHPVLCASTERSRAHMVRQVRRARPAPLRGSRQVGGARCARTAR